MKDCVMINEKIFSPKVSILIPVFNRKEYIAECIQSAIDQNFTDFEIVVVDNASTDGTWEICQQIAKVDQRVRIFRNESNIGPVRNWKRCVDEAKGSLSKILFSDDTLEPDCLIKMVPKLEDPSIALVFCAARIGKLKNESTIAYSYDESFGLSSDHFIKLVLSGKAPVSPGAVLIRTSDLSKNLHTSLATSTARNFEGNGAGPDVMILLLTSRNYPNVAHVEAPLVFFRIHSGSFTILNINNEIIKGYHSAISFFLFKYRDRTDWLKYSAKSWLQVMRYSKRWRNPSAHLIEFEGSGKLNEILFLKLFASMQIANYIFIRAYVLIRRWLDRK
jgi:glycosyltransferase involved in cell wall biosynthesis